MQIILQTFNLFQNYIWYTWCIWYRCYFDKSDTCSRFSVLLHWTASFKTSSPFQSESLFWFHFKLVNIKLRAFVIVYNSLFAVYLYIMCYWINHASFGINHQWESWIKHNNQVILSEHFQNIPPPIDHTTWFLLHYPCHFKILINNANFNWCRNGCLFS